MKTFKVFYRHSDGGYRYITTVYADVLEQVFDWMQGENWSPNGEARPFIEKIGVRHTSMMVGDLILDVETNKGWLCESSGWSEFKGCEARIK